MAFSLFHNGRLRDFSQATLPNGAAARQFIILTCVRELAEFASLV